MFQSVDPQAYGDESLFPAHMRANTSAGFGRVEYNATDRLMLEGGVRYNSDRRTFDNCSIAVTQHFASFWNLFRGGAKPPTQVGDCYVLDPANGLQPVDDVHNVLNQDSVSWKTGLNWTVRSGLLLYANVSKGYKAGAAPVLAASTVDQFKPVPQESLLAYESGFKASLFGRRVQFNASAFYYDYKDKQLRGRSSTRPSARSKLWVPPPEIARPGCRGTADRPPHRRAHARYVRHVFGNGDRPVYRLQCSGPIRQLGWHSIPFHAEVGVDHEHRLCVPALGQHEGVRRRIAHL